MPSTVRTARAPTDLKPNLIRVKKRDDERAHRREGGERVKEFQHLGTSDRVVGRPRTGCVARVSYCECMHPQLVNAILTNICSIVTHTIPRPAEPGCIVRACPTRLRFQNIPDRRAIRDTISIGNDAPRVNVWERGRPSFLVLLNARDPTPGHSYLRLLRRKCRLIGQNVCLLWGIGAGRCPFFSRLNSVPAFNRSDRMCVRLAVVPAGR